MRRSWGPASLVLVLLLAGCTGGDGASPAAAATNIAAPEEPVEGAGSIVGLAVDEENTPLGGVVVALLEQNLQVVSDEAGAFGFQNLLPGTYRVAAQKLGYESVAKAVNVLPGEETTLTVLLESISVAVPYQETFGPLAGYFQCRASVWTVGVGTGACGYVCPAVTCVSPWLVVNPFTNDNSILKFNISSDDVASVVGDMRWTPSAYGTSSALRFAFSYEKRVSSHWWCAGEGSSPLQFVWHAEGESQCANVGSTSTPEAPTMGDAPLRVYANVPFASTSTPAHLSYEQKFEMLATVFYGEPAPEGFSALPDA